MKGTVLEKKFGVEKRLNGHLLQSFTGARLYPEYLDDASYAAAEELDEMLKVYRSDGLIRLEKP
jgi:hypothetical protein